MRIGRAAAMVFMLHTGCGAEVVDTPAFVEEFAGLVCSRYAACGDPSWQLAGATDCPAAIAEFFRLDHPQAPATLPGHDARDCMRAARQAECDELAVVFRGDALPPACAPALEWIDRVERDTAL